MTRGQSILEDLMEHYGIHLPETATRADALQALRELAEALEGDRIAASLEEADQ